MIPVYFTSTRKPVIPFHAYDLNGELEGLNKISLIRTLPFFCLWMSHMCMHICTNEPSYIALKFLGNCTNEPSYNHYDRYYELAQDLLC